MSTPFTMDDEEYFFDAESELDLSEQKNKAVLLMKVTNAYLPGVGGMMRGTQIKGEYSLMPNHAQAHASIENTMAGIRPITFLIQMKATKKAWAQP